MKRSLLLLACLVGATAAHAIEILHWRRLPLALPLTVGQERVLFVDRTVRVGVPADIADRLRVQSAGGAIYLRANAPIEPTRLQLQDTADGTLILLDIAAAPAEEGQAPLEPVRIVEEGAAPVRRERVGGENAISGQTTGPPTPIPVALTRYAAQNLYAPLRTVEPVAGIARASIRRERALDALLPTLPVRATALAAWRLGELWVTAVKLVNASAQPLVLDPRALQGDFVAATFQHAALGIAGNPDDTTVVYLVTRGHGLADALWPALAPVDAAANLPPDAAAGQPEDSQ